MLTIKARPLASGFVKVDLPSSTTAYRTRGLNVKTDVKAKKLCPTEREMTIPLFLLRCIQLKYVL